MMYLVIYYIFLYKLSVKFKQYLLIVKFLRFII